MITLYDRNVLVEMLKEKATPSTVAEGQYHLLLIDVERCLDKLMEEDRRYDTERIKGKVSNGRSL